MYRSKYSVGITSHFSSHWLSRNWTTALLYMVSSDFLGMQAPNLLHGRVNLLAWMNIKALYTLWNSKQSSSYFSSCQSRVAQFPRSFEVLYYYYYGHLTRFQFSKECSFGTSNFQAKFSSNTFLKILARNILERGGFFLGKTLKFAKSKSIKGSFSCAIHNWCK